MSKCLPLWICGNRQSIGHGTSVLLDIGPEGRWFWGG